MKIPDTSQIHEKSVNGKSKAIDIKEAKKKKFGIKSVLKLLVVFAIFGGIAYVWVNAATIFEPLRGVASRIETKTSYDVGFPIKLTGSSGYTFGRFGECFSLLTDTYLYNYETTGAQVYALKHGYSNPCQASNDKRILVFDKSGYSFTLCSKMSLIYQKTLEDKIMYAAIGDDNLAAVVTDSSRYSNVLYIYDDSGNWKYTKKFADENVMQVAFPGDGEHIIVSTLSVTRGELVTNVYKLSIKSDEGHIWKYSFAGNSLPCGMYADKDKIILVCDNIIESISCEDGLLIGTYAYAGILQNFFFAGDITLIHYSDASTNKNILLMLDSKAQSMNFAYVTPSTKSIYCDEGGIYVLDGIHLKTYSRELLTEEASAVLKDDYSDFVKIDNDFFLLGYDTIDSLLEKKDKDSEEDVTGRTTESGERIISDGK